MASGPTQRITPPQTRTVCADALRNPRDLTATLSSRLFLLRSQIVEDRCVEKAESPRTILKARDEIGENVVGRHVVAHPLDLQRSAIRDPPLKVFRGPRTSCEAGVSYIPRR